MNKINNMSICQCADVPMQKPQRRHCGLDPQSPTTNAVIPNKVRNPLQNSGDSCFRRNDGRALIPTLVRICNIFLLLFLFSLSISFGQEQEFDKEIVKANGIKAIKGYRHEIENGNVINSELTGSQLFDKNGNLIEEISYLPDGSEYYVLRLEYDSNGRILKNISKLDWIEEPFISYYVYNEKGENIEIYEIDEQGEKYITITKKYYESGELFEVRSEIANYIDYFDKYGDLIYRKHPIIDIDSCEINTISNVLKTDTIQYIENGKELTKITELRLYKKFPLYERNIKTFDNNGNLIINEIHHYVNDSTSYSSKIFFFNEQGQLIEKKELKFGEYREDYPNSKSHFKLEYYDNGLIKFVHSFNEKGEKIGYVEFQIEYY